MSDKIILTRNQLAKFLPTPEAIRAFENLFQQATQLTPSDIETVNQSIETVSQSIETVSISADSALNIASYALSVIENLSAALEDNLEIIRELDWNAIENKPTLGTVSSQDSSNISISGGSIDAALTNNATQLIATSQTLSNYSSDKAGTISNAPTVGNPTKWIKINDNGVSRYIPAW